MGMFDTYDNLPDNYVPDNRLSDEYFSEGSNEAMKPEKVYNAKGNFIGLRWSKGDILDIEFPIQRPTYIEDDALVYSVTSECPDTSTVGYTGQKAYNLADRCSWTCSGVAQPYYIWVKDAELTLPTSGTKEVYFTEDFTNKTVSIDIYNFRWESVFHTDLDAAKNVQLSIDEGLSNQLSEGIYYCKVKLLGEDECTVVSKTMLAVV